MKQIISVLLACSMIFLGTMPVFSTDSDTKSEDYDLSELFTDYKEYSLSEMVEFIDTNIKMHSFVQYFREIAEGPSISYNESIIFINAQREGSLVGSEKVPKPEIFGINTQINYGKYLVGSGRVTNPTNSTMDGLILLGERGNRLISVEINEDFAKHVCSLDRAEGNRLIVNFFMNMFDQEEVVGVSWYNNGFYYPEDFDTSDYISPPGIVKGDCNGDTLINGIDTNMIKRIIAGNDIKADPFTVDVNSDGTVNAMDSFSLRLKMVE